jgi:hypothetical protein
MSQCVNIVKNGQSQQLLAHWQDLSPNDCVIKSNCGMTITTPQQISTNVTPIADGLDVVTIPTQVQGKTPKCKLHQDISFFAGVGNSISFAQLSWADRILSRGNNFGPNQFATFLCLCMTIWVMKLPRSSQLTTTTRLQIK